MRHSSAILASLLLSLGVYATPAGAAVVGVAGGNSAGMTALLNSNGHAATDFGLAAPGAGMLAGFDALVLSRTPGNADVASFVMGGGLLVTELDAAEWALNTATLLNASAVGFTYINTGEPITFTAAGVGAGLSNALSNPYSDWASTEFFMVFPTIGSGVDILATRASGVAVAVGGASGAGRTLILGWDWQDGGFDGLNNTASEQLLLNAVNYQAGAAESVPEPASFAMLGLGLAALSTTRRRRS